MPPRIEKPRIAPPGPFGNPMVWCVALLTAAEEILGMRFESIVGDPLLAGVPIDGFALFSIVRLFAVVALFAFVARVPTLHGNVRLLTGCVVAALLGTACLVGADAPRSAALAMLGASVLSLVMVLLWLFAYERISWGSAREIRGVLVASSVVVVLLVPAYRAPGDSAGFLCGALLVLAAATLLPGLKEGPAKRAGFAFKEQHDVAFPSPAVFAGFFIIAFAFAFSQVGLYSEGVAESTLVVMVTKLAAVAAFVLLMLWVEDSNFATVFRVIATLAAVSFICSLAFGEGTAPRALMAASYSLFEITCAFAVLNLASYARGNRLILFCVFDLVTYGAVALGGALGAVSAGQLWSVAAIALMACLLSVAAAWAFGDAAVSAFFWKPTPDSPADHAAQPEQEGSLLSVYEQSYGLSEREYEVLELFASGRTAGYIAETLIIGESTVRSHIRHVYEKCGVHSRQELITLDNDLKEQLKSRANPR